MLDHRNLAIDQFHFPIRLLIKLSEKQNDEADILPGFRFFFFTTFIWWPNFIFKRGYFESRSWQGKNKIQGNNLFSIFKIKTVFYWCGPKNTTVLSVNNNKIKKEEAIRWQFMSLVVCFFHVTDYDNHFFFFYVKVMANASLLIYLF